MEATSPRTTHALESGSRVLGPDGPLARAYLGYEPRRKQVEMADLCGQTMVRGGVALAEAGTGIGKSFAYLIPAMLNGERAVISTETIALQQQLIGDAPKLTALLEQELGREVKFAIAKGRGNYLCPRNAEDIAGALDLEGPDSDLAPLDAQHLLTEFHEGRWDGDKATLEHSINDYRWSFLSGDDSCAGRDCPHYRECPAMLAKQEYADADIVIANHRLYLLHQRMQIERGVGILPEHQVWIADEAHTVPDVLGDTFGAEIRHTQPAAFVKRLRRQLRTLKVSVPTEYLNEEGVKGTAARFFAVFRDLEREVLINDLSPDLLAEARNRRDKLLRELQPADRVLAEAKAQLKTNLGFGDELEGKLAAVGRLAQTLEDLRVGLYQTLMLDSELADPQEIGQWVRYVEIGFARYGKEASVTLHCKPIETGRYFRQIHDSLNTVIYTSATLTTGGNDPWKTTLRDFGLQRSQADCFQAPSPFNYPQQVVGYVPRGGPEPSAPDYHTATAERLIEVLNHTKGRAFILFTSHRDLTRVYELVAGKIRFPLLMQGDAPKDQLLREFQEQPNSVLFGCRTFWTGVDIPGEALSCVVIVKLPFPNPSSPLVAARCAAIEKRGGSSFFEYSLPYCVQEVKQGFGRLIRTMTDRGLFVILDGRMYTKRYAGQIASALPSFEFHATLPKCRF